MSPLPAVPPRGGGDPDADLPEPGEHPLALAARIPRSLTGTTHDDGCGSAGWLGECCTHERTIRDHQSTQRALRARRARQEGSST